MCGIAGIVEANGRRVDQADLDRLRSALRHRGPDGEGDWLSPDGSCGFVHLRLAIIDTSSRADQPMTAWDESATIIFNGEIYNFLEIRAVLEQRGVRFRTESDTEVLLEAWRSWGPDMLHRLNGMWALAIRDNLSGRVFLARDRFGIKPLLYAERDGTLAFASEMRALLALPRVDKDVDPQVAARMLFAPLSVEASEYTLHRGIRRLPAGHYGIIDQGKLRIERWWRTTDHLMNPAATLGEAADDFRELFLDSVRLRMRSDVPIGTCLSGGFDSTAVVSCMAHVAGGMGSDHRRESQSWRHAFVASFPALSHDETPEAKIAAAHARVQPHILDMSGYEGPSDVDRVLSSLDDIFISLPSAIWRTYRAVSASGIRVSLDGHGADEMIGAYKDGGFQPGYWLRHMLGNSGAGRSRFSVAFNDLAKLHGLKVQGHMFLRDYRIRPPEALPSAALGDEMPKEWGLLNRRLYGMFHTSVLPTLLRNYDRLSMAHGVEIRMPFMDWRLVTYAMSLPDGMKSKRGLTKLVAREAMEGLMPEKIRTSPRKIGFNSQMPDWLNGSLGTWAERLVGRAGHPLFDELVDRAALGRRIRHLNAGRAWDWTTAGRIWTYVHFKWYLDRLWDGSPPGAVPARQ